MIIGSNLKLEKLATNDKEKFSHIQIVQGDPDCLNLDEIGRAIVVNGKAAVIAPVTLEEGDKPGLMTAESLTYCRKHTDETICGGTHVILEPSAVLSENNASFPRVHDEEFHDTFPSVESTMDVFPDIRDASGSIYLNPKLLLDIAEAIGSKTAVKIYYFDNKNCVLVHAFDDNNARGVLMLMQDRTEGANDE